MKQICLVFLIFVTFSNASYSQNKVKFDSKVIDMGDGKILSSSLIESDDFISQEFKVEVPKAGKYYIAAWINGGLDKKENNLEYQFSVNSSESTKSKVDKNYSHAVDLQEKKFDLFAGINTITFKTKKPYCPNVEFIKVSLDKQNNQISSEKFDKYIDEISKQQLPENYAELKAAAIAKELSESSLKSTEFDPETDFPRDYGYEEYLEFHYSYYTDFYLYAGNTHTFETKNATSDPVLQIFNFDPSKGTWTDDDGGSGYNSKITFTVPVNGYYYLFIRKYSGMPSVVGTCQLYKDGSLYASYCAVSGTGDRCDKSVSDTLNWFTALYSGDSRIWIEDKSSFPGNIITYNDDWKKTSDYDWGVSSRVRSNLNTNIRAVIVSNYSSYNPTGYCDLYMNCKSSSLGGPGSYNFPNLLENDAIQSAPLSTVYQCIAWSGGVYWKEYWPPHPLSPYRGEDDLSSFENFYEDIRYYGAMTYELTEDESKSAVDLWAIDEYEYGYTHASVRKPGNRQPHGYDWESKVGDDVRVFHPRHALNGPAYGSVTRYFEPSSGKKSTMTLDESIARGLSVIENVELTNSEKKIISESINSLSIEQQDKLENKYKAWKNTWKREDISIHSNPRMYAKSEEYADFIDYCKTQGKSVWPFIFDQFTKGDFYTINALEDLTLPENKEILEKIKSENSLKKITASGAIIVRSLSSNTMKYIKKLLKSTGEVKGSENEGVIYSNSFDFVIYPNPADVSCQIAFDLPYDAKVSVQVSDLSGKVLSIPINSEPLTQGNYTYQINVPESFKGTCVVRLIIDNNLNVQLLTVE